MRIIFEIDEIIFVHDLENKMRLEIKIATNFILL